VCLIFAERSDGFLGINLTCFEPIEYFYTFIIIHDQLPFQARGAQVSKTTSNLQ
jgi:hypothetical protein